MSKPIVDIFIPCFIDQMAPEIGFSMVKVLEKAGCDVRYKMQQTCCGQPAYNAGYFNQSCNVAEKWIEDFYMASEEADRYVVVPSASCVGMIRNGYESLINEKLLPKYYSLQKSTFEFTEFLVDVLGVSKIEGARFPHKVTYHDSCSALRECGITEAPRILLNKVDDLEFVEMNQNQVCCGFGGTFSVKFQGISTAMADQKTSNALTVDADYIISTDFSCLFHLEAFSKKNKQKLQYLHIADVLASGW